LFEVESSAAGFSLPVESKEARAGSESGGPFFLSQEGLTHCAANHTRTATAHNPDQLARINEKAPQAFTREALLSIR